MANDKYSIEIELKSKLEEASRAIEQINELKNAANELSKNISSTKTIVNGALYEFGAKLSDLALKIPSVATQAIKAFGEEELAVEKLSAAIRHNGGMVSEVLPIMQELASRMQRITGYADDQVYAMQGVASSMGVGSGEHVNAMGRLTELNSRTIKIHFRSIRKA